MQAVFIFCSNEKLHSKWAKEWPKIRGVFTAIKPTCEALKHAIKEYEQSNIMIKYLSRDDTPASENSNRLHCSFMYTRILKEILLSMDFQNNTIREFVDYCRELFVDNAYELHIINNFEQNYFRRTPIWWYTRECFLYKMLNWSLRKMDVQIIVKMGFFINDLHRHLEELHAIQFNENVSNKTFVVYRGQAISKIDFNQMEKSKGTLWSFNNFLSTSTTSDVSLGFVRNALNNTEQVGILFRMTINPTESTTPFAFVSNISWLKGEEEVLFSMHTIFRIEDIRPLDGNHRMFQVDLTLTSDDDKDLRKLTDCIKEETKGPTALYRLGSLLLKLGESEEAERVCNIMVNQKADSNEIIRLRDLIRTPTKQNEDLNKENCDTYLLNSKGSLSLSDSELIASCKRRGEAYYKIRDITKALSSYTTVLEIQQKLLPSNHPDLGITYNNIGDAYRSLSNYEKAISCYEKALKIQKESLPPHHHDLGTSYNSIGTVYKEKRDYINAYRYFEQAVKIGQRSLQSGADTLKVWRTNLESVTKKCNDYVLVPSESETHEA